ncbi:phage tail protein [Lysinibacillus sphaericus]|uniref:phage tail protein n=1 Tax=Lysinibacillus sphaericus TaxID=1421 RepID=UPI00055C718E|nr:phage tail protein [Lysinibacillus sphaericus]
MIQIRVDNAERIEQLFENTPREAKIILVRAINRGATAARTRSSVLLRKNYIMKAEDIKKRIKIRKATANNLSAQIRASGPVTPLMKFDVTPSTPQSVIVRARVKKGGSRKVIKHGFVNRMSNSHVNVFTRVGRNRLPIKGLYGPSIAQMMGKEEIVEEIIERGQTVRDERLEHELNRLLRG